MLVHVSLALLSGWAQGEADLAAHRLSALESVLQEDGRRRWFDAGVPVTGDAWEHEPGGVRRETSLRDGYEHGEHRVRYADGSPERVVPVRMGREHGPMRMWYANGRPYVLEHFREGVPVGPQLRWDRNGTLERFVFRLEGRDVEPGRASLEAWGALETPVPRAFTSFWEAVLLARRGELSEALATLRSSFEAGHPRPSDAVSLGLLSGLRDDPLLRPELDALWRSHASESRVTMVAPDEPGESLLLALRVLDEDGSPVAGAHLKIVHTDASGRYFEEGGSFNPRLVGHVVTDGAGLAHVATIRPGYYARELDELGVIAAHVHFDLEAEGHAPTGGELLLSDDPRAGAHPELAPVAEVLRGPDGASRAEVELLIRRLRRPADPVEER